MITMGRTLNAKLILINELKKRGYNPIFPASFKADNGKIYSIEIYVPELRMCIIVSRFDYGMYSLQHAEKYIIPALEKRGVKVIKIWQEFIYRYLNDVVDLITKGKMVECSTCKYYHDKRCEFWNAITQPKFICDRWVIKESEKNAQNNM